MKGEAPGNGRQKRSVEERTLILPIDLVPDEERQAELERSPSTRRNGRPPSVPKPLLLGKATPPGEPRLLLDDAEEAPPRVRLSSEGEAPDKGAAAGGELDRTPLRRVVAGLEEVVIFSHMNPDPDTIGSGLGLKHLLETRFDLKVILCYRGIVGRSENRVMMELLAPEMQHARDLDLRPGTPAFLVDAQPDFGFDAQREGVRLVGVVDHHPSEKNHPEIPFFDVRPDYGSTSTIVTEYLRAEGIEPPPRVATALFYGLKTDTCDLSRRTGPRDIAAYRWLFSRVDRELLAKVERPPLTPEFFDAFAAAIYRAVRYRHTVVTELGRMPYPDMVAQVADNLIRLQGVEWAICFGLHEQRIYLSVRSTHPRRDAGRVVKASLNGAGVGGGHDTMAAGRVQLLEESPETYARVVGKLWWRFLTVLGEDPEDGRRMLREEPTASRVRPAP